MSDDYVVLERLKLAYGETVAVHDLDLAITRGELLALLGPSGCGKTTTMRAIAGLLAPAAGRIFIDGADVTYTPPSKRNVGLVFQSYALFPHLSVFENVAFGLRIKREPKPSIDARSRAALATVGLEGFARRNPAELSGGQQQRLALARSLVMEPKLLLLDEPLSNLDARLRLEMRTELQRLQLETGVTMVFVTHDQSEALALADRIVVMKDGIAVQTGTPEEIYNRPRDVFVADFVGFDNILYFRNGMLTSDFGSTDTGEELPGSDALAWRPAEVILGSGPMQGRVIGASFAGQYREYVLDTGLGKIKAQAPADAPPHTIGGLVAFELPLAKAHRLPGTGK
ncbi:MAG: ABC transporter ATP-binding protein [Albidovulum sp.]|nr:ABC transporter ATP-binding protein [Albidovulum sp.]MDE0306264.1 ABC transporter ATP-binding protein [Albidovulum sp.]MDE0531306.1 ABC transporter ATP-binding protein [Albidovulum sp.]